MTINDADERDYPHRPFTVRAISVLAYAQGFTLWHYKCDADTRPLAPGFFNACISAADGWLRCAMSRYACCTEKG